jgi:hypothetical protein
LWVMVWVSSDSCMLRFEMSFQVVELEYSRANKV